MKKKKKIAKVLTPEEIDHLLRDADSTRREVEASIAHCFTLPASAASLRLT